MKTLWNKLCRIVFQTNMKKKTIMKKKNYEILKKQKQETALDKSCIETIVYVYYFNECAC